MGFDTHMILETVPVLPSTRQNAHQAINRTPRHYAEALDPVLLWSWRQGNLNVGYLAEIQPRSAHSANEVSCALPYLR